MSVYGAPKRTMDFESISSVTSKDCTLRNGIRLESAELVRHALNSGANVNCQYPDDWDTPLHMAVVSSGDRQAIVEALISSKPNYGLVNADNLTASELALKHGKKVIARRLVEAEFIAGCDPTDALYELLKRSSVEAVEMLIQVLRLPMDQLVRCMAAAWRKLEVMNVKMNSEVELFAHLTILRYGYEHCLGRGDSSSKVCVSEVEERMRLVLIDITLVEQKFDTGMYNDVDDELLEILRSILGHLFIVKNRLEHLPILQLEYCIALYIAIFDRKPELDIFQFAVNKCVIIDSLKQFKKVFESRKFMDQRMSSEILFSLIMIVRKSKQNKCKQIISGWHPILSNLYNVKEQIMIRNRISKLVMDSDNYCTLTKKEINILKLESEAINRMFTNRKVRYRFKALFKLYYQLKQMYSLHKTSKYLSVVANIELHRDMICFPSMLAIQRALQVVGETLKSTKLSPNISPNLRSSLEFSSPNDILNQISKLRQFFSHDYSSNKHSLYQRLRVIDNELIDLYKKAQSDLLKIAPLLGSILKYHNKRYFKMFLSHVLKLKSADKVKSFAESCRVQFDFRLEFASEITDIPSIENLINKLESTYDAAVHSENIRLLSKLKLDVRNFVNSSTSMTNYTDIVMPCIGNLLLNDDLSYQQDFVKFILSNLVSPHGSHEGGAKVLIMYAFNAEIHRLIALETKFIDERSEDRLNIIHELMGLAAAGDLASLQTLAMGKDRSSLKRTQRIVSSLGLEVTSELLVELDKLLDKYYSNLFALDDKYRIVKGFCKKHGIKYNNPTAISCRKSDEEYYQRMFNNLLQDVTRILSLPERMNTSELMALVANFQTYMSASREVLALEIVLLEVLEILSTNGALPDNRSALSHFRPTISGRNLRNYLAHDSLVYDTICRNRNAHVTVMLNAICLSRYANIQIFRPTGQDLHHVESFGDVFKWQRGVVGQKMKLFQIISDGDLDQINDRRFELKSRLFNNVGLLQTIVDKHSEEFINFLIGKPTRLKPSVELHLERCPNDEQNFYDDDTYTIRGLMKEPSYRQNMSCYLAMKHHHNHLESTLTETYTTIYDADSLHMSIMFKNEDYAISIMNCPRLYDFCTASTARFDQTHLMLATLNKLPRVVHRICELSPQILECTNSTQETALYLAVGLGCKEIVSVLLEFGARIHYPAKSPIVNALSTRKDDILEMMLPFDEELLADQELLGQLVRMAGLANHTALLERILPLVKSSNALAESLTGASSHGSLEAVKTILDFDASIVNATNASGITPLYEACHRGNHRVVKFLLSRGANCSFPEHYPAVHLVMTKNQTTILKWFLKTNRISNRLQESLFEMVYRSKPRMAWMVFKAGYPCKLTRRQTTNPILKLLLRMCRAKPDFTSYMDCFIVSNAILLQDRTFVMYVLDVTFAGTSEIDRCRMVSSSIQAGDKDMLRYLVDRGCDVNQADSTGVTPLGLAVTMGKPDMIRTLLKAGADPNIESSGNGIVINTAWSFLGLGASEYLQSAAYVSYPIIFAIANKANKVVEFLLQFGAHVNVCDRNGVTPLIGAILAGNEYLVELLLARGAYITHHAAKFGHVEVFKLLIKKMLLDPADRDSSGDTALHVAVASKQTNVVSLMVDYDCWNKVNFKGESAIHLALSETNGDIFHVIKHLPNIKQTIESFRDDHSRTVLHIAVRNGCRREMVVELLMDFQWDTDCYDDFGNTPLYYAVEKYNVELIKLLISEGSSLSLVNDQILLSFVARMVVSNRIDIIQYCLNECDAIRMILTKNVSNVNMLDICLVIDSIDMCQFLLECAEFDINAINENGSSVVHTAACTGSIRMMELLLRKGANLESLNRRGETPLTAAIGVDNWKVAHFLSSKGCSRQAVIDYRYEETDGMSVLHCVAAHGKLASLRMLIDQQYFPRTLPDLKGRTVGHYAAANNQGNIIEYLISTIFPFDMEDEDGKSSLLYAIENEHLDVAERLILFGSSLKVVACYYEKHSLQGKSTKIVQFLKQHCHLNNQMFDFTLFCHEVTRSETDQTTKLRESCMFGHLEDVRKLVELGAKLDIPDNNGATPLISALLCGNVAIAKYLIAESSTSTEQIAQYRLPSPDRETLLHAAAQHGRPVILELLLQLGVLDVDIGDNDGTTALQVAAMWGQKECVELLLRYGADAEFVDQQGTDTLTRACTGSHDQVVRLLLERNVSVENARMFRMMNDEGQSLLHLVVTGNVDLIGVLVATVGIDINERDSRGRTPLHYAAGKGLIEAVDILMDCGADLDAVNDQQETPFISAILAGHDKVAVLLVQKASETKSLRMYRSPDSLKSVLHIAYEKECYRALEQLIAEHKFDCDIVDGIGKSILHYGVADGNTRIVEISVSNFTQFLQEDNSGETPLSICIKQTDLDIFRIICSFFTNCEERYLVTVFDLIVNLKVYALLRIYSKWLLENKTDFIADNQRIAKQLIDLYHEESLDKIILENHTEVLQLLFACGMDQSVVSEHNLPQNTSWLHFAAMLNFHNMAEILITQANIPVDSSNANQQTPLLCATVFKHFETVEVLLRNGANPNCLDENLRTPLLSALENDHVEMVQLLLSHGASVSLAENFRYKNNAFTILHYLAERGLVSALPLILPTMTIDCTDTFGMTPLHYAASCNQRDVIKLLLQYGAKVDCTDRNGTTPLIRAAAKGHVEVYEQLVQHGADRALVKQFRGSNYDGESVLHITAEKRYLEMTKLLVEELEVDIDCVDKFGCTPLHGAITKGCFAIVKYLLQKGASLHIDNAEGKTALNLLDEIGSDITFGGDD